MDISKGGALVDNPLWTNQFKDRLMYISYWIQGGTIGSSSANFEAKLVQHPLRANNRSLSTNLDLLDARVDELKERCPNLNPATVNVLFDINTADGTTTDNARFPSAPRSGRDERSYGIAHISSTKINNYYIGSHEYAHSLMNWLDEYPEGAVFKFECHWFRYFFSLLFFSTRGVQRRFSPLLGIYPMRL